VQALPLCAQLPLSPHDAVLPAVQLVAQQTFWLVIVSSVTHAELAH
jgi:hypothetical protein